MATTLGRTPRRLLDIYTDLLALTAAQKTNIGNDLFTGSPKKVLLDNGTSNSGAIAALHFMAVTAAPLMTAAMITDAKLWAAAMYVQDNIDYAVNPSFDPTINVPGASAPG